MYSKPGHRQAEALRRCQATFATLAMLAFAGELSAEEAGGPNPEVKVNLWGGVFETHLPFDEDFVISGKAEGTFQEVAARFQRKGETDWTEKCKEANCQGIERCVCGWARRPWDPGGDDFFKLTVPHLESRSNYSFELEVTRKPTTKEMDDFESRARTAVDQIFRELGETASITEKDAEKLKQRLTKIVEELAKRINASVEIGPKERLEPKEGSIFRLRGEESIEASPQVRHRVESLMATLSGTATDRPPRAFQDLAKLLDVQNRRFNLLQELKNRLDESPDTAGLVDMIKVLLESERLADLLWTLQSSEDEDVQGFLKDTASERALLARDAGDAVFLAHGVEPGTPRPDLEEAWDPVPSPTQDLVTRLEATSKDVRKLSNFISRIRRTPALLKAGGLTAKEMKDLESQITALGAEMVATLQTLQEFDPVLEERAGLIAEYVGKLRLELEDDVPILGTTEADFQTAHGWYVSADLGVAVAPEIDDFLPYFGLNFYFRPVNKRARLPPLDCGFCFWRRFSMMIGMTGGSIEKTNEREGVFGENGLLVGGGLRLNRSIRVTVGSILYKRLDPNPLIDRTKLDGTYFVSFSFDWDVQSSLGGLGKKFGLTNN